MTTKYDYLRKQVIGFFAQVYPVLQSIFASMMIYNAIESRGFARIISIYVGSYFWMKALPEICRVKNERI